MVDHSTGPWFSECYQYKEFVPHMYSMYVHTCTYVFYVRTHMYGRCSETSLIQLSMGVEKSVGLGGCWIRGCWIRGCWIRGCWITV